MAPSVVAMVMTKTLILLAGVVLQLQNEEFEDDDGVGSYM